eukprot:GEMP01044366.1.p1 GENE.GEMP01044366.1~~GEMP01044366.1.p1  ORF type:complete len:162 (+),score=27.38 GEMP01044366.1:84-569(+)
MDNMLWQNFVRALRRWDREFLGVGGGPAFGLPSSLDGGLDRLRRNGDFFGMNYVVVLALLTILAVLLHPILLIVAIMYGILLAFIVTRPPGWVLVPFEGQKVQKKEATLLSSIFFIIVAFFFARLFICSFIFFAILLVCGHGVLRIPLNDDRHYKAGAQDP